MTARDQLVVEAVRLFNRSRSTLATPDEAIEDMFIDLMRAGWVRLGPPPGAAVTTSGRGETTWIYETVARVCAAFDVPRTAVFAKRVREAHAWARDAAAYLIRRRGDISWPVLGGVFGKDHSTLIVGHQKLLARMATDDVFRRRVEALDLARRKDRAA